MKLILEFTEFNNMRLNNDSVPQSTHVDNPQLSMGNYNRFQANLNNSLNRLNDLYKNVSMTTTGYNLKSGNTIELKDIKNIKILRIYPKDDIYLNVYFTFELDKTEYYGVIKKINSTNPKLSSEIFKDINIYKTREWQIRVEGNLIKAIKKWLSPSIGKYVSLKEIDASDQKTGNLILIPVNSTVNLIRSSKDEILIEFENNIYKLTNKNFYYFNYYFQKLED
jgi:hypothetical protein